MKYFNKLTVFFLFVLFSYGVDTFAWTYRVANETGGDVKVQLRWLGGNLEKEKTIKAGSDHTFRIKGGKIGLCLYNIKVKQKRLNGSWGRAKKARIGAIGGKDLENAWKDLVGLGGVAVAAGVGKTILVPAAVTPTVASAPAIASVAVVALALAASGYGINYAIETTMCKGRDFTLGIHPKTMEVEAYYVR